MLKKLAPMLIFNVIIGLFFIFSNLYVWGFINSTNDLYHPTQVSIDPLQVSISHMLIQNGLINLGTFPLTFPNFPFILFWVALVGNICLFVLALRSKETKQTPS
jgi:hypothetical protein